MNNKHPLPEHFADSIENALAALVEKASKTLGKEIAMPSLVYNQRGKIAGSARLQTHQIRLNPILLMDNLERFIHEVLPHELAHLIVFKLYGKTLPHGHQWKSIMQEVFNLPPLTRHNMDVSKVAGPSFQYRCGCNLVQLSIRRHKKVLRGQHYKCIKCREILTFDDEPAAKTTAF